MSPVSLVRYSYLLRLEICFEMEEEACVLENTEKIKTHLVLYYSTVLFFGTPPILFHLSRFYLSMNPPKTIQPCAQSIRITIGYDEEEPATKKRH